MDIKVTWSTPTGNEFSVKGGWEVRHFGYLLYVNIDTAFMLYFVPLPMTPLSTHGVLLLSLICDFHFCVVTEAWVKKLNN